MPALCMSVRKIGTVRMALIVWSAGVAIGCSTPANIREKSAAATALYAQVETANAAFADAVANELKRRDRLEAELNVRSAAAREDLQTPLPESKDTQGAIASIRAVRIPVGIARIAHGTVDRFLRIDVVDLDEVRSLTSRAQKAFGE